MHKLRRYLAPIFLLLLAALGLAADSYITQINPDTQQYLQIRLKDNGDGTYSMAVAAMLLPYTRQSAIADNTATDSAGIKLSYTVPSGKSAKILSGSWFNNSGAPTVQLEMVTGANTIVIRSDSAGYRENSSFALQAGDVIRFNVTTVAVAGSTADGIISYEEYTP